MADIIKIGRHFSGAAVLSRPVDDGAYPDNIVKKCIIFPLPSHSEFNVLNILRTLQITHAVKEMRLEALAQLNERTDQCVQSDISVHLTFRQPVRMPALVAQIVECVENEYQRRRLPFVPSKLRILCENTAPQPALPAPRQP